jgi:hypothetical protein
VPDNKAKQQTRDIIKETLTPQRLSVMSWAFAAIFFGCLGLAAFHFGYTNSRSSNLYAGAKLPPSGPISSTGSIGLNGQDVSLGVLPSRNGKMVTSDVQMEGGQIQTLQLELVALRRRLSMLSEQNQAYSRRISALESTLESQNAEAPGDMNVASEKPETAARPETQQVSSPPMPQKRPQAAAANTAVEVVPAPETMPELSAKAEKEAVVGSAEKKTFEPVRFVQLPEISDQPVTTGSINPQPVPEPSEPLPLLVVPSTPSGRVSGSGKAAIGRTDFGAVVGRYDTPEAAAEAWQAFKTENSERMRDIRPVVTASEMNPGQFDLLVGPFANAANAAVACLQLLEITDTCHPALFIGQDLPVIAKNQN